MPALSAAFIFRCPLLSYLNLFLAPFAEVIFSAGGLSLDILYMIEN